MQSKRSKNTIMSFGSNFGGGFNNDGFGHADFGDVNFGGSSSSGFTKEGIEKDLSNMMGAKVTLKVSRWRRVKHKFRIRGRR